MMRKRIEEKTKGKYRHGKAMAQPSPMHPLREGVKEVAPNAAAVGGDFRAGGGANDSFISN